MKKMFLKTVLAAGFASILLAQKEPVVLRDQIKTEAGHVVNQTFQFVAGELISGPPVKGAPYSGEAVNETVQTLADGNRIVQRSSAMQYRDSDGRERREETSAMGAIFITDPVAGARYTLHPESQSAEKGSLPKFSTTSTGGRGGPEAFTMALAGPGPGGRGGAPQQFMYVNSGSITRFINADAAKTEQLGNMYIEGVQAQGTRTTVTIPAGEIGNDRPINVVDEQWYSPDLQMTVMTKHSDPRSGETSFQLKNINRSGPPPTLFEIPSNYTLTTGASNYTFTTGSGRNEIRLAVPAATIEQRK